jgi:8-oxo-dGTP pyrophosphatase MutT (NUDIX family)
MLFLRSLALLLSLTGIRGVGIILVDREGRFLVNLRARHAVEPDDRAQRPARAFLSQRWAILAGAIERGEAPQETALREVREETGHVVARLHPVVSVSWPRTVHLYGAGLTVPLEELHLGEGMEHRLVRLDEVPALRPKAPLLGAVLRAFAGTPAYQACLREARETR